MHDESTLTYYADHAESYIMRGRKRNLRWLDPFMAALPCDGTVLELGCGDGQDCEAMLARGFLVTPTDGVPEIAKAAENRLGRPVAILRFGDLDACEKYDGIWANACLLHVPRAALPTMLSHIHTALKPGGILYASFKAGAEEGRDRFGRYFNFPTADWLRNVFNAAPWRGAAIDIIEEDFVSFDPMPKPWLHVFARKRR